MERIKSLFASREDYLKFIKAWKETYKTNKKELTLEHYLLYAMFRRKDWTKCITPCSEKKLASKGMKHPYITMSNALYAIHNYGYTYLLEPFKGTITDDMFDAMRGMIPTHKDVGPEGITIPVYKEVV